MKETCSAGVRMDVKGPVLEATLVNHPDNRITTAMLRQLGCALDRSEAEDIRLLVLQGDGRCFSKGFDLAALDSGASRAQLRELLVLSNALFSRLARFSKPTVAAIDGACLGGGLELALACHFRVASDRARFGLPEIWIKLVPGLGGVRRLSKVVGPAKALELVALGDLINAEEALRLDLVSRVFPRAEFSERVASFTSALLLAEPQVLREALHLVASSAALDEEDSVREGMESFAKLAASRVAMA